MSADARGERNCKRWLLIGCACGVLVLSACGGGGGGSSSSGSGSSSPPPPVETATLSVASTTLNVTSSTSSQGTLLNQPFGFDVLNAANSTYYYAISYIGTAIAAINPNGVTSRAYNTGNSTLGSNSKLVYPIGATISGTMLGSSNSINTITFFSPGLMGAGTYSDTLTISVCTDAACQRPISGSPKTVSVTYTVTGNPISGAIVTVYGKVMVEAPSAQNAAATGTVNLTVGGPPPTGAYVSTTASTGGLVTSATLQPGPLPAPGGTALSGTVNFSLKPPSVVGAGVHSDSFQINVCFDAACAKPAIGSPYTVNVSYVVDPTAGVDYTEQTLALSIAGLVWDAQRGMLYAIIPSYSAQYPNTLAQINPITATVVATTQLNGGVGHIEPGTLAVSDDGNYLYVAVSDASGLTDSVERIRTSDLGLDLQITLAADNLVSTIREAPGEPHVLAIDLAPPSPGIYIYNDAVATGPAAVGTTGASTPFVWGGNDTTLFADVRSVASGTVDSIANNASGPSVTKSTAFAALSGTSIFGNVYYVNGEILWDGGATFNTTSYEPGNAFPFYASSANNVTASAGAFDATLNRAYFLTSDQPANAMSGVTTLQSFGLSTQSVVWLARFPSQNAGSYLTRWGSNGLAFVESGATQTLVLISGSIVTQ